MINNSFVNVYLIFNLFLLLFSAYIFLRTTRDLLRKSEFVIFRVFIVIFQLYVIANSLWTLQEYDIVQMPHGAFVAVCFISLFLISLLTFEFYSYTLLHFGYSIAKNKTATVLGSLPFGASLTLLVISLFNGTIFSVTPENNIVEGPLYLVFVLLSFVYFVFIIIFSVMKAHKMKTRYARREALILTGSVIFLGVWALFDDYFDRISIIPVAAFAVIFFNFISLQQSNIYTDALTNMNNRRKLEEYLTVRLEDLYWDDPICICISDLNSFKEINDTYGHIEGDSALIMFSTAIKGVMSHHAGFAARYGGDEFVWAWTPDNEASPEFVANEIRQGLEALNEEHKAEYSITFCMGYVVCDDPRRSLDSYLKEADEMLYENKRIYHSIDDE